MRPYEGVGRSFSTNNLKTILQCHNLPHMHSRFFVVLSIVVDVEVEEVITLRTNDIRIPAIPWRGSFEVSILGVNRAGDGP
jgi:hypothetical protein